MGMAHIGICNNCRNAEAEQKDKQGWTIIIFRGPNIDGKSSSEYFAQFYIEPKCVAISDPQPLPLIRVLP